VQAWQADIATYATADQFTGGLAKLRALKATDLPVYTQAHHVLAVAAKAAGMKFDVDAHAFRDTGVRPPAPALPSVEASSGRRAATWQPQLLSTLTTERAS